MAAAAAAIDQAAVPKSVSQSLWWDSFVSLFTDLENAGLSTDLPPSLVKKLKNNHDWFLNTLTLFKPPSETSRSALNSPSVNIGSHHFVIQPELKESALQVSSCLTLDEVQAYILVNRFIECNNLVSNPNDQEFVHLIMVQYYLERQCLLKCTRQILMHAISIKSEIGIVGDVVVEALLLIDDGLEGNIFAVLKDLLSSNYPGHLDVELSNLWAEETLIEDNLVLDVLFLIYYEPFYSCSGEQWKNLCLLFKEMSSGSCNIEKLSVSEEAAHSLYYAKVQLLLILIETLDLDNLLRMVHNDLPFRWDRFVFSLVEVQEMDNIISGFNALEIVEAGPLILAWAVFVCLMSSVLDKQDCGELMEIDHVGYVSQAFESAPLHHILEILRSDVLRDSDGPIDGYRSVLKTFISAFIASYDITYQIDDNTFSLILDILCEIYRGQESLCMQFWDRDSFVDEPIRHLLFSLESEFPIQVVELVRLLSALCEGPWPAECVYNYLDKMVHLTSLFEIPSDSSAIDVSQTVETHHALHFPGLDGLVIPSRTIGRVLKIIDGNIALIRWETLQSGVVVLLLHLAQEYHLNSSDVIFVIVDLLCRMVSFNKALGFALMEMDNALPMQAAQMNGQLEKNTRIDVANIICTLISNFTPNVSNAKALSMCITILAKLLKCFPSHVTAVTLRTRIFDIGINGSSSGTWLLSGGLARMFSVDSYQNEESCHLAISVLDFTIQLVEAGAETNVVSVLVVFALQYILVNHEHWKYKSKHLRWKVTLKLFELINKTIKLTGCSCRLGSIVRNILLCDSSLHSFLLRILCVTTKTLERLYINRHYEPNEIEGLQLSLRSALDIVFTMLSDFSEDITSLTLPLFVQAMLCATTKPVPVVTAVMSLICFFRSSVIQVAAARVLSMLCIVFEKSHQNSVGNLCFVSDDLQIRDLSYAISDILSEEIPRSEDLFVAVINLLIAAARYQPAFLVSIVSIMENAELSLNKPGDIKHDLLQAASFRPLGSKKASIIESLLEYVKRSEHLVESHPRLLLSVLNFLRALWQGNTQYMQILKTLKSSEMFWKYLSCLSSMATKKTSPENKDGSAISLAYIYQCQAAVLEIMAHDIFLQQKLLLDEMPDKHSSASSNGRKENIVKSKIANSAHLDGPDDILSSWCRNAVMEKLIRLYASCEYDKVTVFRAQMAASLCFVHIIGKVSVGDVGSLSLSFIDKINMAFKKLREQPAYRELAVQYSLRDCRDENELNSVLLGDLCNHIQGELEDLQMKPGPFKELSQYLLELDLLQTNKAKCSLDFHPPIDAYLFDPERLQEDIGLEYWYHSNWKESKEVAESMLLHIRTANVMAFLSDSQLAALKALTAILSVHERCLGEIKPTSHSGSISEAVLESCIDYLCKQLHKTGEYIVATVDNTELILNFLESQALLLLNLVRCFYRRISQKTDRRLTFPVSVLVIKTVGTNLRVLIDTRLLGVSHVKTVKVLLAMLLTSIEFSYSESILSEKSDSDSVDAISEVSLMSLGLLPILCNCVETADYSNLSLAAIDTILKGFLASNTWLPVLQKHLRLQLIIQQLRQKDSLVSIPMILRFLLTLARTRGGAEMLRKANFFSYIKLLFSLSLNEEPSLNCQDEGSTVPTTSSKDEKSQQHTWGLGLAIVTATIYSLGEDSSSVDFVESVISYFLSEKASLMDYYLSAPDLPIDDHSKKRARIQRSRTSLMALRETENTLMLICGLAKHQPSWIKAMRGTDSQLRERSIHLLAFISRGAQRFGESKNRKPALICHPVLKEEVDLNGKPPFVNCKHGWFNLFAVGYMGRTKQCTVSSTGQSSVIKDRVNENGDLVFQTYFSDLVATQMYRIAFLLLKFLCMQAKAATKRAEDVGLVDLAHFPELPMPEILHGLQDQAVVIVTELCAGKSRTIDPEIQSLCFLLLQVTEMALYLELCVSQIYGIRPVSGRIEDFTKEIKVLMQLAEEHTFLKASIKSLKQIITLVYPGLLQTEGIL